MGKLLFKNISKAYGNGFCAVNKFNLEIQDGEFIVLVGPSGCGKSTILRMIAGLEKISDGELILDDKVINKCPPVERDIAVVFQDYALYGNMSVYDNVGMSMRVRHEKDTVIYDKVKDASGILGIESLLKRLPGQLSGGQKQRVALARSVVRRPKVFLMDEPLSNLDAKLRTSTRAEIVRLQRELKVTTVYVTHDQTEAMTMADRMVVLKDGIIQQAGTPKEIYYEPCNLFVAGFIGAPQMNFIEGKVEGNQFVFDSHSLVLPQRIADPLKQYSGRELILGIRPEHFSISNGNDKNVFKGELENKEFLGSSYILYVRIGESVLTCQVESTEDCFDRQVNLHFGMEHIYFFDKKTTELVMHAKAGENDE